MPKFVQEILDNLDFDFEIEIPDFSFGSDEEVDPIFEDAFIPENILTL